jgi:hypothetical protein
MPLAILKQCRRCLVSSRNPAVSLIHHPAALIFAPEGLPLLFILEINAWQQVP